MPGDHFLVIPVDIAVLISKMLEKMKHTEWAAYGFLSHNGTSDLAPSRAVLTGLVFSDQQVTSGGAVELEPEDRASLEAYVEKNVPMYDRKGNLITDDAEKSRAISHCMRFHIHSHHKLGTSPSARDNQFYSDMSGRGTSHPSWIIAQITSDDFTEEFFSIDVDGEVQGAATSIWYNRPGHFQTEYPASIGMLPAEFTNVDNLVDTHARIRCITEVDFLSGTLRSAFDKIEELRSQIIEDSAALEEGERRLRLPYVRDAHCSSLSPAVILRIDQKKLLEPETVEKLDGLVKDLCKTISASSKWGAGTGYTTYPRVPGVIGNSRGEYSKRPITGTGNKIYSGTQPFNTGGQANATGRVPIGPVADWYDITDPEDGFMDPDDYTDIGHMTHSEMKMLTKAEQIRQQME